MLYKWDKSNITYGERITQTKQCPFYTSAEYIYTRITPDYTNGRYIAASPRNLVGYQVSLFSYPKYYVTNSNSDTVYTSTVWSGSASYINDEQVGQTGQVVYVNKMTPQKNTFIENVYSSNKNAYPNGGEAGGYWYVKTPHNYSMKVRCC